jgi:outer membrane protein OmpA-like peptidoglycan-associated protein
MKRQFIFRVTILFVTIFFIGCTKSTVILLDSGKAKSAVIVSTDKGSSKLDEVGKYVDLKDKKEAASEVKTMSKKEIESRFSKVLSAAPLKPIKYMVYFKPKSKELTDESKTVLVNAIEDMKKRSPCMVDIIGHTDTTGSNELNIKVSLKRAKYIESILKERGVKVISLTAKGYGEEDLQVKTADNVAEDKNRNVEIFIK